MPAEDRDRLFEQALAGQLRRESALSQSACLDPEALAAYHERLLSAEEMNVAKEHLVSCARCQQVLAQLEATQEIVESQDRELVSAPVAAAVSRQPEEMATSRVQEIAPKIAAAVVPLPAKKLVNLGWAVPAGAIAAAFLLWVGVRTVRAPHEMSSAPSQVAERRAAQQPPSDQKTEPAAPQLEAREKQQATLQDRIQSQNEVRQSSRTGALKEHASPALSSPTVVLPKASNAPARRKSDDEIAGDYGIAGGAGLGNASGASSQGKNDQILEKREGDLKPAIKPQAAPGELAKGVLDGVRTRGDSPGEAKKSAEAAPPPPPPARDVGRDANQGYQAATSEIAANAADKDQKQKATLSNAILDQATTLQSSVMDATGTVIWRFGDSGVIVRSEDGGKSWRPQSSGVSANLTSGSAPSKKICWIAGTAGTLLLTTDGGKYWKPLTTPISGDLGGVQATDAEHATIWDAAHHATYQTADRGATWTPVTN